MEMLWGVVAREGRVPGSPSSLGAVPAENAAITTRSVQEMGLRERVEAYATFKAMAVHLC
jgi:hypothetical protein